MKNPGRSNAIAVKMSGLSKKDLMMLSAYTVNCPVTDPSEMTDPLPGWKTKAGSRKNGGYTTRDKKLAGLAEKLLSFGGSEVCLPGIEEDLGDIMKYGQLWYGRKTLRKKGRPSGCHENSADLYYANENALEKSCLMICTGYALSDDGIWRQHSWLAWIRPRCVTLVETTEPREAYFGFCMTKKQCGRFVLENM